VDVDEHRLRLTTENAEALFKGYEIVVDGSDNFATRYAISDACVKTGRALVSGSLERFRAQVAVFAPPEGPCYRCLFPLPPAPGSAPSCSDAGVVGVLPGLVGVLQAAEALKLALGRGQTLTGNLLTIDLLSANFEKLAFRKDPACPACGQQRSSAIPAAPTGSCGPGREAAADDAPPSISPGELRAQLAGPDARRIQLVDVRMPWEWDQGYIEGAVLVPLQELSGRLEELDPGLETVVYCAVGERSAYAVRLLLAAGFSRARNLEGGLRAWDVLGAGRRDGF
jgi:adenylyltransferase/sulfurtransferase